MLGNIKDEKDIKVLEESLHKVNAGLSVNPLGGIMCSDPVEEQVEVMSEDDLSAMLRESESRQEFHERVSRYCGVKLAILGNKRGAPIG